MCYAELDETYIMSKREILTDNRNKTGRNYDDRNPGGNN